jgi:hypothetical protein
MHCTNLCTQMFIHMHPPIKTHKRLPRTGTNTHKDKHIPVNIHMSICVYNLYNRHLNLSHTDTQINTHNHTYIYIYTGTHNHTYIYIHRQNTYICTHNLYINFTFDILKSRSNIFLTSSKHIFYSLYNQSLFTDKFVSCMLLIWVTCCDSHAIYLLRQSRHLFQASKQHIQYPHTTLNKCTSTFMSTIYKWNGNH